MSWRFTIGFMTQDLLEQTGLFYVRFMDDWLVLAPTRWKLRKAIRLVNQILAELKVEQHPDKTFIGRISRGFSFLGYQMNHTGLFDIAPLTKQKHAKRLHRLYEQGASESYLGEFVRRWWIWVKSGAAELISSCGVSLISSIHPAQVQSVPNTEMQMVPVLRYRL